MNENGVTSLKFIRYDKQVNEQTEFANEIVNDIEVVKYIDNMKNNINSINCYLVKDLVIDKYIGLFFLTLRQYGEDIASLSFAVHKDYRHSNKKYGTHILKMIDTILLESDSISKIILEISSTNPNSVKAAKNAGFVIDNELAYSFSDENYPFIPFAISNPNYIDKNKISSLMSR